MGGLLIVLMLVTVIAATTALSQKISIPGPVLTTLVGIALGFTPGFPAVRLNPELVLLAVLPPLVYAAAVQLPWEEFRSNLRPISFFAVGLVIFTAGVVAAVSHALIPHLSWAEAFALGAIISPTDPVASTAVTARLGAPRRLVAIIEGEGLLNDAIALTILRLATAAALAGSFSITAGLGRFAAIVAGEPLWGLLVGWIAAGIRSRTDNPRIEIAISLLTPFAAYLVPEWLGGSGVLAALSAGMYIGIRTPELVPSGIRLPLTSVWDMVVYLLNGFLFLLTGIEFRSVVTGIPGYSGVNLLFYGAVMTFIAISLRYAWTWPSAWATDRMAGSPADDRMPDRQLVFLASCGMRGGISLAAALSLSDALPARPLILFITACVIAGTLILQGGPLPFLLRRLGIDEDANAEGRASTRAEARAREAAIRSALDALATYGAKANLLRERYEHQLSLVSRGGEEGETAPAFHREELVCMNLEAIAAERKTVIELHRKGQIPEHVLHRIERDLDLNEVRLRYLASDGTGE